MSIYRLEIDRGETLWVMAHDEQGAIKLAAAHLVEETNIDPVTVVQLKHGADETLVLRAAAGKWKQARQTPDRQRV